MKCRRQPDGNLEREGVEGRKRERGTGEILEDFDLGWLGSLIRICTWKWYHLISGFKGWLRCIIACIFYWLCISSGRKSFYPQNNDWVVSISLNLAFPKAVITPGFQNCKFVIFTFFFFVIFTFDWGLEKEQSGQLWSSILTQQFITDSKKGYN